MDDLISRKAAIDAVKDALNPSIVSFVKAKIALEQLPSAQPDPKWIPCSERMPEKYIGQWLCCTSDGAVMILPYDTPGDGTKECVFYKWDDDGYSYQIFDIVAWMPLPEPWKGEEE